MVDEKKSISIDDIEESTRFKSPIELEYSFSAGKAISKFLRKLKKGILTGQKSPVTGRVIIPPRGTCPETGTLTEEEVVLDGNATIFTFTIVHLPIPNSPVEPPFVVANLVADGSDQTFIHLVSECDNDDVHIGMRVKAIWKDPEEWDYALENIKYFVPSGEPSIDVDQLRLEHQSTSTTQGE